MSPPARKSKFLEDLTMLEEDNKYPDTLETRAKTSRPEIQFPYQLSAKKLYRHNWHTVGGGPMTTWEIVQKWQDELERASTIAVVGSIEKEQGESEVKQPGNDKKEESRKTGDRETEEGNKRKTNRKSLKHGFCHPI